jgi:hypothetical protein
MERPLKENEIYKGTRIYKVFLNYEPVHNRHLFFSLWDGLQEWKECVCGRHECVMHKKSGKKPSTTWI